MVDRLWAQWQLLAPQNALAFAGGSVQARDTFKNYQRYPNGGPPFLNVSPSRPSISYHYSLPTAAPNSVAWQWALGERDRLRRDGHEERDPLLYLRVIWLTDSTSLCIPFQHMP